MIAIAKLIAILPAFIAYTSAAPIQGTSAPAGSSSTSKPPALARRADAPGGVHTAQAVQAEGIVAWANGQSQDWQQPKDSQATATAIIDGPSHLVLDYTLLFEQCGRPEVVAAAATTSPGLYCPDDVTTDCQIQTSCTSTFSDAYHLGTKLSITLKESATVGVPAVESVSVGMSVTSEFSEDYTTTSTRSTTEMWTFPVPPGKTCIPTQVSWTSQCQQSIQINSFKWYGSDGKIMWPDRMDGVENLCSMWQSPSSGQNGGPPNGPQWLIAGDNDISGNFQDDLGSHFDLITSICSGTMPAPVNMAVSEQSNGAHKSYLGCEW